MKGFTLKKTDSATNARRGELITPHGSVETPVFMPVGTRGTIKGLTPEQITETGSGMILANTYHLLLRPGVEIVENLGGLHQMMAWDRPILTDSGGYQVFSLSGLNRIGDDGVEFASHIDGRRFVLDAKIATDVQNRLGADVIMCFDECAPFPCQRPRLQQAVERSIRWARQCKESHKNFDQMLFGIVQGGIEPDLRQECAEAMIPMDFDGYAIGGLSVGEGHEMMIRTVAYTAPLLPENKPRYLMGVGMPADIMAAVRAGVDMFDCVLPTRNGRNAFAFTAKGPMRMRNSGYLSDPDPIEADCPCYACRNFSRAAIRHFFNVGEMLGPILVSIHNLVYYQRLMQDIRDRIDQGTFEAWSRDFIEMNKTGTENQTV